MSSSDKDKSFAQAVIIFVVIVTIVITVCIAVKRKCDEARAVRKAVEAARGEGYQVNVNDAALLKWGLILRWLATPFLFVLFMVVKDVSGGFLTETGDPANPESINPLAGFMLLLLSAVACVGFWIIPSLEISLGTEALREACGEPERGREAAQSPSLGNAALKAGLAAGEGAALGWKLGKWISK